MDDYSINIPKAFAEGYSAVQEVREAEASKDVLKQAYAGVSSEEAKDPEKQMSILMSAGSALAAKGFGAKGFAMMKEANSMSASVQQEKINKMTVFEQQIGLASQVVQGASSYAEGLQALDHLKGVLPMDKLMQATAEIKQAEQQGIPWKDTQNKILTQGSSVKENLTNQLNIAKSSLAAEREDRIRRETELKDLREDKKIANSSAGLKARLDRQLMIDAKEEIDLGLKAGISPRYDAIVKRFGKDTADNLLRDGVNLSGAPEYIPIKKGDGTGTGVTKLPDTTADDARKLAEAPDPKAQEIKNAAQKRIDEAYAAGRYPKYTDYVAAHDKEYADSRVLAGDSLEGAPSKDDIKKGAGKAGVVKGDHGSWLENRANNIETRGSPDPYSAKNPNSSALGKYQFTKDTWDAVRKEDPSLPPFDKLKGNKKAQDEGAAIHEKQIENEIKKANLPVNNANKDLWWHYGDSDAKKLLAARPDAKVSDVLSPAVVTANKLKNMTVAEAIDANLSSPAEKESGGTASITGGILSAPPGMERVVQGTEILRKAADATAARFASNTLGAFINANKEVLAIGQLPVGTVFSAVSGLEGKDQKGVLSGLQAAGARYVTSDDDRAMQQYAAGLERSMAVALAQGQASGASAAAMEQLAKEFPREGDSGKAAVRWLARVRQQLESVNEAYQLSSNASREQKKKMAEETKIMQSKLPSLDDVNKAFYGNKESMLEAAKKPLNKPVAGSKDVDTKKTTSNVPVTNW